MHRYLMLLGVVVIVFSVAGGAIEISNAYNAYQSRLHVSGVGSVSEVTLLDQAQWQAARLVGGAVIFGGVISGSILMGLAWIGKTMEEIRNALAQELAEPATVPKS